MSEHIRTYVADLAAYNAGHLLGIWIDTILELDDIQAQVIAMLAASLYTANSGSCEQEVVKLR